jgi:hypothetical protein
LRQARAELAASSSADPELSRHSRLALEIGDGVLDPVMLPRHGSGAAQAAELFRQALHWALAAAAPSQESGTEYRSALLEDALKGSKQLEGAAQLAAIQRLLYLGEPFVFFAGLAADEQRKAALLLRESALRVLGHEEAPLRAVRRLQALRWARLSLIPLLALCLGLLALWLKPEAPDLAQGKPWRTSSVYAKCQPERGLCAGIQTRILFHTREDASPWFEYDLGAPTRFSSLTIENRRDGNGERALPLIVEVGDDGRTYRELARRTTRFDVWEPDVGAQQARYVRLRVPRRTYLHLEQVEIHP